MALGRILPGTDSLTSRSENLLASRQDLEFRPFQSGVLEIANQEPSDSAIYWFYSMQGNVGKTRLAEQLIKLYDALLVKPKAPKRALDGIRQQLEKSAKFQAKPIIIVDLGRSASTQIKTLYETLETIQGSFSDSNGTTTWPTPPHVFVFANDTPETGRLTADRLRVHLITKDHELQRATHIENELKAYDDQLNELQRQEEEAARSGELPPRLHGRGGAGSSSADNGGAEAALQQFAETYVKDHVVKIEANGCDRNHLADGSGCKQHFVTRETLAVAACDAYVTAGGSQLPVQKWRPLVECAMKGVHAVDPSEAGKQIWCWVPKGTEKAKRASESPTGWKKSFSTIYFGFKMD